MLSTKEEITDVHFQDHDSIAIIANYITHHTESVPFISNRNQKLYVRKGIRCKDQDIIELQAKRLHDINKILKKDVPILLSRKDDSTLEDGLKDLVKKIKVIENRELSIKN